MRLRPFHDLEVITHKHFPHLDESMKHLHNDITPTWYMSITLR